MEFELELREAAMEGNVPSLLVLLGKDRLLLDRIMTGNQIETPLHIAAMLGHLKFVEEVLAQKAELAKVQNSQGLTPLHLAAAKGYLNIVECLLRVSPEMCSIYDRYKRNPLHVAAMKGHVDVLECLVQASPDAARNVAENGQTILHLCVKHNRLEALKVVIAIDIIRNGEFINSMDEDGNTILHLAAADRQTETIDFLIDKGVNPNIKNSRGFTALRLSAQGQRADRVSDIVDYVPQISESHDQSRRIVNAENTVTAVHPPEGEENNEESIFTKKKNNEESKRKWQESMHETVMLVAVLIATVAFQAGITPPGGTWQDDFQGDKDRKPHIAGYSIMADKNPSGYESFVVYNTISLVASLSIILLRISGRNSKQSPNSNQRSISTWIAMLILWVAIISMASTYTISLTFSSPNVNIGGGLLRIVPGCVGFMVFLLLLVNVLKFILKVVRKVRKCFREFLERRKREDTLV